MTDLRRYAWLSVAAAIATILLKGAAWWMTGSVGLLSDAIESFVNLAGALMALWMLTLAAQPADDNHPHGHGKAEYFSSAFEGFLIVVAAVSIAYTAIDRLLHPQAAGSHRPGLLVSLVASVINFCTARVLLRAGREHNSITLEADAHHLMTDVWTSAGVIARRRPGLAQRLAGLDPAIAMLVAANIVWTGWQLMQRSAAGLMDIALPAEAVAQIEQRLSGYAASGISYHALRTRQAGRQSFVSLHVLVPGHWTVQAGHDWAERIEADLRDVIPHCHVTTHLEPAEDPRSLEDQGLDRHAP
jgi:cation diffusion facilitator family transporter